MAEKMYVCGYKYCLYPNEKVSNKESVIIGKRHYHTDCAKLKQTIKACADLYIENVEDKTVYPVVIKIINTLVFKNRVPVNYIKKNIMNSQIYYSTKPVFVLYGIRKLFYTEMQKAIENGRWFI